jgi:PIN domain
MISERPCVVNRRPSPRAASRRVRLVLDTNVVVSALLWRGTPYRLLEAIRLHTGVQLFSSTPLLEELVDVVSRPFAVRRLAAAGRTAFDILSDYTRGRAGPGKSAEPR